MLTNCATGYLSLQRQVEPPQAIKLEPQRLRDVSPNYTFYSNNQYILESSGGALRAPPRFSRMLVPILVPSTWNKGHGTKYLVPNTWYQILGTRYLVPGSWYQVLGTKYLVPNTWYQVLVTRGLVRKCAQISSNVLVMNQFTVRDQDNI